MAVIISKDKSSQALIRQVQDIAGVDLSVCYQCKRCTSGCPVSDMTQSGPAEIIRHLHLDAGHKLLESDILWMCVSCETCSARCPMDIDIAAVMDALRHLAVQKGTAPQEGNVPLFNRAFLKTVELFGRTYDIAMIAAYKMGSRKLLDDTEKFPTMLKKGKIALFPPRGADKTTVKRIFGKTKEQQKRMKDEG